MIRISSAILLLMLVLPLSEAAARQSSGLEPGQRVRIRTDAAERFAGRVASVRDTVLLLSSDTASGRLEFPFRSITDIEVRRRASRGEGAWKWAKRGFAAGAVAGALVCGVDVEQCRESPESSRFEIVLGSALFVGTGVAFIGAVGGAIFPGGRWESIPVPEHVLLLPEETGGLAFSARWRF